MQGYIIGSSHTPMGRLEDDLESLVVRVTREAIEDAGLDPQDIDAIYLGHFNSGMNAQSFTANLVQQADPGLRFKRATRVENACATGSAAVHAGLTELAAGRARHVLVVGVEKMTGLPAERIADSLLGACYRAEEGHIQGGFAGVFGQIAETYFKAYGDQREALAAIAAKNHRNGVHNPYAQLRKDLGFDFCNLVSDKNPTVSGPLRRTDCSPISDGAAALVLTTAEGVPAGVQAARFRAIAQVNDFLPMSRRDMTRFEGAERAWGMALEQAGIGLLDLSLVETHDCFTVAELIEYEAMGLTAHGEGAKAALEGWTEKDGRLPVNPSGGLKAKGHPIGATGVSMHVLAAQQVTGRAPEGMQIADARLAGVFNMGGAAVANYVSILEAGN